MKEIKLSDIKPVGNFDKVLTTFTEKLDVIIAKCDKEQAYNSALAEFIKYVVGKFAIISVLEEGLIKGDVWNKDEALIDLLYTHILIIRANDCAHKYLNKITPDPIAKQLNEFCQGQKYSDPEKYEAIYKDIKIID